MRQQMRTGIGFYLLILVIIAATSSLCFRETSDSGGQKVLQYCEFHSGSGGWKCHLRGNPSE